MLAVVFPGQGSQSVGMSADFARDYPEARAVFEEADDAFGGPLSRWIEDGPEEELRRTEVTQPAILAASIAAYRVLEPRLGLPPAIVAGHSLGEYSALVAAGGGRGRNPALGIEAEARLAGIGRLRLDLAEVNANAPAVQCLFKPFRQDAARPGTAAPAAPAGIVRADDQFNAGLCHRWRGSSCHLLLTRTLPHLNVVPQSTHL